MKIQTGVVLAGGESRRTRREGYNKLVYPMAGRPLVWYALDNLRKSGIERILLVVGHDGDQILEELDENVEVVRQEQPLGTGHALLCALPVIQDDENIVVLYGDCPFIDEEHIEEAMATHLQSGASVTLGTSFIPRPDRMGGVILDQDGNPEDIVELNIQTDHTKANLEVFAGLSVWSVPFLNEALPKLGPNGRRHNSMEVDLPDCVSLAKELNKKRTKILIPEPDALAPNDPDAINDAAFHLQKKVKRRLTRDRVVMRFPDTVTLDYDVSVGARTKIYANVQLTGTTIVGERCEIGPGSTLHNCVVGDGCVIGSGSWEGMTFQPGSHATDRLSGKHPFFQNPHFLIPEELLTCFVIMPFSELYDARYQNLIKPVIEDNQFRCLRVDERTGTMSISDDIWEQINRASLIVAEISEPNPNVWYELGLAHALNKRVIHLRDKEKGRIPFDVQSLRLVLYDVSSMNLQKELDKWLRNERIRIAEQSGRDPRKESFIRREVYKQL